MCIKLQIYKYGENMSDLQKLMYEIRSWSVPTFGDRYQATIPVLNHLKKEIDELILEIEEDGDYSEEFADCFMLLLDAAGGRGLTAENLIDYTYQKLNKNKTRTWGKPNEDGVIEHIE
jgi:NTP pyrophosphatase (non-canonical NTP hydrolase)